MSNKEKVFVLGMARSGYEAAKFLASKGYDVVINDAKAEQNTDQIAELKVMGVEVILGDHPDGLFDNSYAMIVKNPGIRNDHKYILKAKELDIPVINELELGFRYFPSGVTIIGVTGTNGKTTTTTIIYEMLKSAEKPVYLMGNIGYPVCSFVPTLKAGAILVMEVSDHQLCNVVDFKTNISVLTNISEAHLDFHDSYETYKNIKKRIFKHHTKNDIAILNLDDDESLNIATDILSTKKYFSSLKNNSSGCCIIDSNIYWNNQKIISLNDIKIKGRHNYENIMAAIMVVKELGVDNGVIVNVLKTFCGVEHRIEYVREYNGRKFYNDSKSTNVTATQTALSSFNEPTILLMGGLDRGHSFEDLLEYLGNVKSIIAYGEVKERIKSFADKHDIACEIVDNLEGATNKAYLLSKEGDVILLSPACASWDQFKAFEERGNKFKEFVNNL
ncbi:MAG: UDP-N-acetylmuramoyl-L-alanine--D-glutamate ligase [Bacilli bacterium]|nr:UDP-N-acetylmuramoyl-L-alanine--D-glutamate ligase [Bacilli bacterium]